MTSNDSWQKVRLGDLAQNVTINEYEPLENGLTKYVAGDHLESKKLFITKSGDLKTDKEVIGSAFHRKFSSGDILFGSRRVYLRKTGIATFDGLCSNTTLVIRKKSDELADDILPFIFRLRKFTEYAIEKSTGSVTPYVLWRNLADFTFDLPSKPEQLKMKETLWSIQTSIDNLENLLEKTKNYLISRRESLLTRGIGHTKFKKVPWYYGKTIEIPEEWEIKHISDIMKITMGQSPPSESYNENGQGLPFYQGVTDFGSTHPNTRVWCTDSRKIAEENSILFSVRAPVGEINLTEKKCCLGRGVAALNPIKNDLWYCYYLLIQNKKWFYVYSQGTTYDAINRDEIGKTKLPYTKNIKEQQKIVSILSKIDNQIIQQQSHLNDLYSLQDSILNSKLTKEKTDVTN